VPLLRPGLQRQNLTINPAKLLLRRVLSSQPKLKVNLSHHISFCDYKTVVYINRSVVCGNHKQKWELPKFPLKFQRDIYFSLNN
jgi:hypothetical protein